MILTRRCSLAGVQLDELDPRIVIRSIEPGTPRENVQAVNRMGYAGQRMTGQHWESLEAKVTYAIDIPKRNLAERREVIQMVNAWAMTKGYLRMTGMTDKRLYVDKVTLPDTGDLWDWTAEYTISFFAYNVPFWQDNTAASMSTGTSAGTSKTIEVGGNVKTVLNATFQNKSGKTITRFSISAGGNTISLTGLTLSGNGKIEISHGNDGLLRITADGANVYSKYTGSDDLYVNPGSQAVSFTADRAGVLTVSCYGRWIG